VCVLYTIVMFWARAVALPLCVASTPPLGSWEQLADAQWPTRGHFGATRTTNGTILVAGGMHTADNSHLQDVWASKDGEAWVELAETAPWPDRHRHGMLFFEGCSYVFGGTTIRNTSEGSVQWNFNDVWKSCDEGRSWACVTQSAEWSPREGFAYTVAGGKMLIIGGTVHDVGGAVNEVWASDDGERWQLLGSNVTEPANAWAPRYALTAVTMSNGEVLIAGGFGAHSGKGLRGGWGMKDVWASQDGGYTWTQRIASAPFGRRVYVGLAVSGGATYLFGGQAGVGQLFRSFRDVWVTEDGSRWRRERKMPKALKPRGGMCLIPDGGSILMLGGSSEIFPHKDFNDVWRFSPSSRGIVV